MGQAITELRYKRMSTDTEPKCPSQLATDVLSYSTKRVEECFEDTQFPRAWMNNTHQSNIGFKNKSRIIPS